MSIAKPFTFVANTYAKASEVNADFDTVYSQVNTNISAIAQNATDIDNLENNKADINGSAAQRFAVADATANNDAVNKQTLFKSIGNSLGFIEGLIITKDSGSPEDTIIVDPGSCYDSTYSVILKLSNSVTKQNQNQGASTIYYIYIIGNSTGTSTDILISQNQVNPSLPSGYTLYRKIGYYYTDSNSHIKSISYFGTSDSTDKNIANALENALPDYDSEISIDITGMGTTNQNFTVPSNGYLQFKQVVQNGGDTFYLDDKGVFTWSSIYGTTGYSWLIPVYEGTHTFRTSTSADRIGGIYFYPIKGAS